MNLMSEESHVQRVSDRYDSTIVLLSTSKEGEQFRDARLKRSTPECDIDSTSRDGEHFRDARLKRSTPECDIDYER